MLLREGV